MFESETNKLIIFCAPSGSGKTTIVKKIMDIFSDFALSISATNRSPRPDEVDSVDYHFVSTEEFKNKINQEEFIEWEEVYKDKFYGTLKSEVSRLHQIKKIPVFDIDVKGAMNLKKMYGELALVIFIKVPMDVLKTRLFARHTETPESFKMRIDRAEQEMKFENLADVVIMNIDLEVAVNDCKKVITDFLNG